MSSRPSQGRRIKNRPSTINLDSNIEPVKENIDMSKKKVVDLEHETSISPFDLIGLWDKKATEDILVTFSEMELTHDIIGENLPSDQYWISSIELTKACYTSKSIKIDNVLIPFSSERGYGHNYIYICLPDVIEKLIKRNASKTFSNIVGSKFRRGEGDWWKPAYHIEGVFKVADKDQICTPVSLAKILNHTKMGVRANILAEFAIKRTIFSVENVIKVKIISAFITSMGVYVNSPTPLGIIPGQPRQQDITSDDIMKNLKKFKDVPSPKQV